MITSVWAPVFEKVEPNFDLESFLSKIEHLLPNYSSFILNTSDAAILTSLQKTPKHSAPGPDGIPYALIRNASEVFIPVIQNIIIQMASGSLPSEKYTDGFINFIPKKDMTPTPNNLRPLTIPNSLHRLVGKIISDQLQPLLEENIHPAQSAFITGRSIINNICAVDNVLKKKKEGWLLFVNFSKAYDSIDQSALISILKKLRFPSNITTFIRSSLQPYKVFSEYLDVSIDVKRGVPQGWSLSCVLFNIVIDPLLRTLAWTLPELFQSAFTDDLSFHHFNYNLLPVIQKFIQQYGNAIGLAVNERKCAVIDLQPDPPQNISLWSSPSVTEYRYLGILLGTNVPIEKVFKQALEKLRDRVRLFSTIRVNLTSKILISKIYLYPLMSFLLNFYSFPLSIEKAFCSLIQKFIFPYGNVKAAILFSYPNIIGHPYLENPRAYALRFTYQVHGEHHHLLELNSSPSLPKRINSNLLLEKIEKHAPVSRSTILNFTTSQLLHYKIAHFYLQLTFNCLTFHSRMHHILSFSSECALCKQPNADNPKHLFTQCALKKDATILLKNNYPQLSSDLSDMSTVMMSHRTFTPMDIYQHVCFTKALWKARSLAIWTTDQMSPQLICSLFYKALGKSNKPPLTTRSGM